MGTSSRRILGSLLTGLLEYQQKVKISIKKTYVIGQPNHIFIPNMANKVPVWDSSLKKNQYSS